MRAIRFSGVVLWACALIGAGSPVHAQGLVGRVQLGWQSYSSDDLESDGFRQRYELRLARALSEALSFELRFRGEDDDSGSTLFGVRRAQVNRQLEPGGTFSLRLPTLFGVVEWDELEARAERERGERVSDRTLERSRASLAWSPVGLPTVSFELYDQSAQDELSTLALEESWETAQLDHEWRGLRFVARRQRLDLEDRGRGFQRQSRNEHGELGWNVGFWGDRVSFSVEALGDRLQLDERALAGGATTPRPVPAVEAFSVRDETPADSIDLPFAANPRLRDGDLATPAGASLGPLAPPNLNLALSLGFFARLDELRIVARDGVGNPLASGGAVVWDVYTSLDGQFWTRIETSATAFDPLQGHWSVTFAELATPWIKVVTFFVNTVETEVTELQAFDRRDLAPGQTLQTEIERRSGSAALLLRPASALTVTLYGRFEETLEMPEGEAELETSDRAQTLNAIWEPKRWLSVFLQGTSSRTRQLRVATEESAGLDEEQNYDSWLGTVRLQPSTSLIATLEASRSDATLGALETTTDRYFLHGFARFWHALDLRFDVGQSRTEERVAGTTLTSPSAAATVQGALTRTLQLNATLSYQRNELSGGDGPLAAVRTSDLRWRSELFWRPSVQLGLGVGLGRATDGDSSVPLQTYRLEWRPFPGGAVGINALYDENVDPAFDRRFRRLLVSTQWRINPRLSLNLDYGYYRTESPTLADEVETLFAGLDLNL